LVTDWFEVGGHDVEIGAVDLGVEIGVAEEGVGDFDLAGGETGGITGIGGVGVANAVAGLAAAALEVMPVPVQVTVAPEP